MRLLISTPGGLAVDAPTVTSVRAEDESGSFGLLPRHDRFVTVLTVSVLTYRTDDGAEHFVAVRGGTLLMMDGATVRVATREAATSDDLAQLESAVLQRMRATEQSEADSRAAVRRLEAAAIRQLARYAHPDRAPEVSGGQARGGDR